MISEKTRFVFGAESKESGIGRRPDRFLLKQSDPKLRGLVCCAGQGPVERVINPREVKDFALGGRVAVNPG